MFQGALPKMTSNPTTRSRLVATRNVIGTLMLQTDNSAGTGPAGMPFPPDQGPPGMDLLAAADLFVLPSHREGMPRSIIEAMATGLPVVATDIRGAREEVVPHETGLLVPYDPAQAGDPEFVKDFEAKFAENVNTLTRDRDRARQMGLAGRQRCIDEFSWEKIAQETVEVYEKAIATHNS